MRDFDRPLDNTGNADAETIGNAMRDRHFIPEITLCSNAARARQTLEGIAASTDTGRVFFMDELYSQDSAGYLEIIQKNGAHDSMLIIGHNPMMEDLAIAVAGSGDETALNTLHLGFPTSGLAVIEFDGRLTKAAPGKGYLSAFLTPAEY